MNVNDKHFNPAVKPFVEKAVVLAGYGFRDKGGVPENMKICKKELGTSACVLKLLYRW